MAELRRAVVAVVVLVAAALLLVAGAHADKSQENIDHIREHVPANFDIDDSYNDDVYFFTLHDFNGNGSLDGHEIRVALLDSHTHQKEKRPLEDVERRVDAILAKSDKNGDGVLSFGEFNLMDFYTKF